MAHVVDKFDLSNHDKFDGTTKDEWTVHQIHNTFDFAVKNKLVTWYCGGVKLPGNSSFISDHITCSLS
jgi:hypothetical protein